ncbi:hypothetical protein PVK06_000991 [Gossypium arboreum]|uniref:Protein SET DOMAIN GROUP 40-like n=1 Tax=Gossypium arboreum TaxID=29729 RepID=A0ABR0R017_GOSAR|nr:hypothetical protein PVK06_000991 [Gossypium arboreum]
MFSVYGIGVKSARGRGVAALRPISKGELLLKVPKSALITTGSLLSRNETLSLALKAHLSHSSTQVFTVCLLYEINKGKASPWHPYFLHLPHSYSILAAFGELETQALKVDYAIWAAQKAVTKAKYEWEQAFTLMKELKLKPPLLTFRAWILATGTISSQCLCFPGIGIDYCFKVSVWMVTSSPKALDLKPNYVRAWANMGISYANQV